MKIRFIAQLRHGLPDLFLGLAADRGMILHVRLTVDGDTPARAATSLIVTGINSLLNIRFIFIVTGMYIYMLTESITAIHIHPSYIVKFNAIFVNLFALFLRNLLPLVCIPL